MVWEISGSNPGGGNAFLPACRSSDISRFVFSSFFYIRFFVNGSYYNNGKKFIWLLQARIFCLVFEVYVLIMPT